MPEETSSSNRAASTLETVIAVALVGAAAAATGSYLTFQRLQKHYEHAKKDDDDDDDASSPFKILPPLSILEFEQEAKRQASPLAQIYINYHDGQGLTGQACRQFFQSTRLMPRILQGDLSNIDTQLTLFPGQSSSSAANTTLKLPVLIAPTAFHNLTCRAGEVATARACGRAGAGYSYNWMLSSKSYLEVLKEEDPTSTSVKWLHLYMYDERDMVQESIRLAEATGAFSAIILTCDHPHLRVQNRMVPSFVKLLPKETAANHQDQDADNKHHDDDEYFFPNQVAAGGPKVTVRQVTSDTGEEEVGSTGTNSSKLSWKDVEWIKSLTKLPVVVKGVLSPADAIKAMEVGAAAIVVSNHGGRQFDGAPPAIEVLPSIAATVQGKIPILVDSGIRTSTDIVKALCLGASGVMLGRPALWALSCGGEESLFRMLNHLHSDIVDDMRSLGARSIKDLDLSFLYAPDRERIERDMALVLKE
jgi:4-hydroxymandelate oxidase